MKYMGSKRKLAKHIAPIIQGFIESGNYKTYIEPFVGGANMIEHIRCESCCGADNNRYLIALLQAVQGGWLPPDSMTENEYNHIRQHPNRFTDKLVGFAGFPCSYAAKWFGGYCRGFTNKGVARNYIAEAYRNVTKQAPKIQHVQFTCEGYQNWCPENAVIYCDPPYANTTKYKTGDFDYKAFWAWCREIARPERNNVVLVSEYNAPDDIECIWSKEITSSLTKDTGSKKGVEKLFWVKP